MTLTLRQRIVLTILPLVALLAVLGAAGVALLYRLGGRIDEILRENYDSVLYMERLHEALERIDSSFQFALAGRADMARRQYDERWPVFDDYLRREQHNVTVPGEQELVDRLTALAADYRRRGDAFYALDDAAARGRAYFGDGNGPSLYRSFGDIKQTVQAILRLNQDHMEQASAQAKATAARSVAWLGGGLALAVALAGLLTWHTVGSVVGPIRAVTRAARGIAAGDLDQVVPRPAGGELGEMAEAFTAMASRLRDYRRSQQDRLLRARQASQATIDSFPDPVLVVDPAGAVEMANPAARRLLGTVPGSDGAAAAPWTPPAPLRQPLADALAGRRHYLPEGFEHAVLLALDGQPRTFLPRILTIHDDAGGLLGAAVVLQDVTRLRLLDEVKSNLVATVSHELKTPLTGVRLAIHLLLEEAAGPLTDKQTELLLDARENSERLLGMVENLLHLARLEQGSRQLDLRPEDPRALLQAAADAAAPRARDRGVELAVNAPPDLPAVPVDAARLGTALDNLLQNALTYTERGGKVALTAAADGNGGVALTVADTGTGIPPEYLPHVFERFFRVPGQSQAGGTGLGLAIVREVVAAHGGTVRCASAPGQGTTFRITLPAAAQDRPAAG